jgi:Zn-dependent metalloprotease/chitodextrinase
MKHFYSLKLILFSLLFFAIQAVYGQCGVHPKIVSRLNNGAQPFYSGSSSSVDPNWYIYKYQWLINDEVSESDNSGKLKDWNPKLANSVNKISLKVWAKNVLTGDSCFEETSGMFQSTGEPFYPIVNNTNSQQIDQNSRTVYGIDAAKIIGDAEYVRTNIQRNTISFVKLRPNVKVSVEATINWLNSNVLRSESGMEMKFYRKDSDKIGYNHLRYMQFYKGVPVEYSMYIVHAKDGHIVSANGEAYLNIKINTKASIAPEIAKQKAYKAFPAGRYITEENNGLPKLFVLPLKDGAYSLVYKVDVNTEEPLSRQWVYVNAESGAIIKTLNRLETYNVSATADTRYSGLKPIVTDSISASNYRLRETGRGAGTSIETYNLNFGTNYGTATDFTNASKTWAYAYDNAALDAHFGAEKTYDHYFDTYGYNSIDNAGFAIKSYVHYSNNYVNAFWNGSVMTYGDGNGVSYNPLTSLEIVGHEITHGVTENSAGLIYSGESGALNESFSDVMGNTIRFKSNPSATWLCGDQIVVPGSSATPFRNLANPNDYQCADTYGGQYFNNGDIVHYDSGIQNFWYYLLTQGGVGVNDIGSSYTVIGIGLNKANAIAFRNLTVYLTPSSTFADARAGAIQSAIDLYGACSDEVIQTTNAWYAVGVGGLFNNAVVASFNANNNFYCSIPANVSFTNTSLNATSFHWDFGDGSTSTLQSPAHIYSAAGNYTVTLMASGIASCGNADTMIVPSCINVSNGGGPIAVSCIPTANTTCCGYGIMNVHLESINKNSNNATEGYRDFTCSDQTLLVAGNTYPFSVTTGSSNSENVSAWIDFNNDGVFATSEKVFSSLKKKLTHSGYINTPTSAVLNTSLRMRVIDEDSSYSISGPCYSPTRGQVEDYTVSFVENTLPPIADFSVSKQSLNVGDIANFYDLTANAPTGWTWSFPGGTPSSSTLRNPIIQYSTIGVYPVTLHVLNSFGTDSITKTSYISVMNIFNMCSSSSTVAPIGILYDSGGPTSAYLNGENCSFLISPACTDSVILTINSFQTESSYDYLRIYDGTSNLGTLLFSASGSTSIQKVKAPSGKMFIQFTTDGSVTYPGFDLSWTSILYSSGYPTAQFSVDDTTPPVNVPVQFNDLSTNAPNAWQWNFGDGNVSTLQNPTHAYTTPGIYTVRLIVYTCSASDTTTLQINIQDFPVISSNPDSISVTVSCGDSIHVPLMVYNTGSGDLVISGNTVTQNTLHHKRILVCTYGVDMTGEYINTIAGINSGFTDYSITQYNGIDSAELRAALDTTDILLFPERETGTASHYVNFGSVVQRFVNRGGNVIVCTDYDQRLTAMGLLNNSGYFTTSSNVSVLDTSHFIMDSVPPVFAGANLTIYCTFSNVDRITLAYSSIPANEVVTYREIGQGSVTFIGFDYYTPNTPYAKIISNAVKGILTPMDNLIEIDPNNATIAPGDSELIYIVINTANFNSGQYDLTASINSNDSANLVYNIPCHVNVIGSPHLALSDTCLHFAQVFQNEASFDSVEISNNGCDTLYISSITSSSAEFTPAASGPIALPPFSNYTLQVQLMSASIGSFAGQLTLHNNDHDTSICLIGAVVGAPISIVNPDTMFVTVNCTDSITRYLTLSNIGLSDLDYDVETSNVTPDSLNILVCTYGVDMTQEYLNMISALNSRHMKYKLTQFNGIDATGLTNALVGKDVLLFPEQESGASTHYSSWVTPIATFLANGGRVVVAGTQSSNRITTMGLITGTYQSYVNSGILNSLDTTHFVADSIALNFNASNSTFYHTFTDVDCVHLVKYTTYDVVSYKKIGNGDVVFLGFDYYESNRYVDRLLINSIFGGFDSDSDWLSVNGSSGTLSPGDSVLIPVVITTNSQVTGTDTSSIVINTNDPLHPQIIVPVIIEIIGAPSIVLQDSCLDFGTVLEGNHLAKNFEINNIGCDTLVISNIVSSTVEFSVDTVGPLSIPPGESYSLSIEFNSATIGSNNGSIQLFNNDHDTSICLTAFTIGAPIASVVPDTIYVTQNCGDSLNVNFTIYNSGLSDLNVSIDSQGDSLKILACTFGVDLTQEYAVMTQIIRDSVSNYSITTFPGTDSAGLAAALVGKHVLLFPEQETGASLHYAAYAPVISRFMANGGRVVVCGSANTPFRLNAMGLFSGTNYQNVYTGALTRVDSTNFIIQGIPPSFPAVDLSSSIDFTDTLINTLIKSSINYDVVAYKEYGEGAAIYLGFDYFATSSYTSKLLVNCVSRNISNLGSAVSINEVNESIPVGDSLVVPFIISSVNLNAGIDTTVIEVATNDPQHPIIPVVVILTTVGAPNLVLSDTCINFGSVQNNSTISDTLRLFNNGCDAFSISSILMSNPAFTYSYIGSGIIPPDGALDVIVNVSASDTGWFNGTLTIQSNIADTAICLSAYSYGVPKLEQFSDTIFVHASACNNAINVPLTVYNVGEDTLIYHSSVVSMNSSTPLKVVALTYGVDIGGEYSNTLAAINQNFTNYTLTVVNTASSTLLANALVDADVLLMAEPEIGVASNFTPLATVIQNFVSAGNIVIYCGADATHFQCILNTGIITGSSASDVSFATLTVLNSTSPYTAGVSLSFLGPNATYAANISNANKTRLISYGTEDVFSYVNYGLGKAFYLAFDYFAYTNNEARLIGNILSQVTSNTFVPWATSDVGNDTVMTGDSSVINIVLTPDSASFGLNTAMLLIPSNDPLNPVDSVVIIMMKDLDGCASISMSIDSCGHSVSFDAGIVSPNATYAWTFGDGFTSNIKSPLHYYTNAGTYTIRLIVSENGYKDTTFATVNVGFNNAPLSPSCTPSTLSYCCEYGIWGVQLQSINKLSNGGSDGYQDYSCSDSTTLNRGQTYSLNVLTDTSIASNVSAWIDYNNDGVFSLSEQLFTLSGVNGWNAGSFTVPVNAVISTPLRLRIGSDNTLSSLMDPCMDLTNGQYEDYTVWLRNSTGLNENSNITAATILPNPFGNETTLTYELKKPTILSVKVFDALGRLVNTPVDNEEQSSGIHNVRISAEVSGVYYVRLIGGDYSEVFRIIKTK